MLLTLLATAVLNAAPIMQTKVFYAQDNSVCRLVGQDRDSQWKDGVKICFYDCGKRLSTNTNTPCPQTIPKPSR